MSLKFALLGVLEARPMTGYELSQFFEASTRWLWSAKHSQIYPLLAKLEAEGLVSGVDDTRGKNLKRRIYAVTPAGHDELNAWVAQHHPVQKSRDPFLLQAIFFDQIDPPTAARLLRTFAEEQRAAEREAGAHERSLSDGTTMLIQERLRRRPPEEHERIMRLKAAVFHGQAAVARARAEWAESMAAMVEASGE